VTDSEGVAAAEAALFGDGRATVAIDVEWGATFPVSIVQLSVSRGEKGSGEVYVLDLLSPCGVAREGMASLLRRLLDAADRTHTLVGFAFARKGGDWCRLRRALSLDERSAPPARVVDLQTEPTIGLAAVVAHRLGRRLDKSMQRSDWERRPLSEEQLSYCVADVYVLQMLLEAGKE